MDGSTLVFLALRGLSDPAYDISNTTPWIPKQTENREAKGQGLTIFLAYRHTSFGLKLHTACAMKALGHAL